MTHTRTHAYTHKHTHTHKHTNTQTHTLMVMYTSFTFTYAFLLLKTIGHALWSGVMTVYTITAVIVFEESALIQEFGEEYKQYMKEVPGFIPDLRKLFQIR